MLRKRQSQPAPTIETYLFRIKDIAPDYGFYVSRSRWDVGPYGEHAQTKMIGTILVPSKQAGRETCFTFIGARDLTDALAKPDGRAERPNGIGTLTVRGAQSRYLGLIPFDVLLGIAPIILAGGLKFIVLNGPPLFRCSSRISSLHFLADAEPDDY